MKTGYHQSAGISALLDKVLHVLEIFTVEFNDCVRCKPVLFNAKWKNATKVSFEWFSVCQEPYILVPINDHIFYYLFLLTRNNIILDNRELTVPSGFPLGPVRLNGSLWIGGVDDPTLIPGLFPVINSFEGGMTDIKLNGE